MSHRARRIEDVGKGKGEGIGRITIDDKGRIVDTNPEGFGVERTPPSSPPPEPEPPPEPDSSGEGETEERE